MELKDILDIVTTILATFLGAWLAFMVERRKASEIEETANFGATNQAIYAIFEYWNGLEQYRKECIEDYRGKPDAWLNMSVSPSSTFSLVALNPAALSFLLHSGKPGTYASLMLEEHRYRQVTGLIEMRASIILNEVHPRMAAAGLKAGHSATEEDLERILGFDKVHKLKLLTTSIIRLIDQNLDSLRAAHDELRLFVSELYPKRKAIRVDFKQPIDKP